MKRADTLIVDLGLSNIRSVQNMLTRIGAQAEISSDREKIDSAQRLILPGVGAFDAAMGRMHSLGLQEVLTKRALIDQVPTLGLCLGLQLMTKGSEEGKLPGLGWLDASTKKFNFDPGDSEHRVPHMGWNTALPRNFDSPFASLTAESRFYFVHSYYVECANPEDILFETIYGRKFTSAVLRANIMGTQFHPEKSHRFGMALLEAFLRWMP